MPRVHQSACRDIDSGAPFPRSLTLPNGRVLNVRRSFIAMISIASIFTNCQVSCVRCNYTRRVFELLARSEGEQGGCSPDEKKRSVPASVNRVVSKIEFAIHVRCFCVQVCKCRSLFAAASAASAVTLFYTTAFSRPRLCGCSRSGCV